MTVYCEHRLGKLCKRFSSGKGISAEKITQIGHYPVIGGNGLRGFTEAYNFDGECAVIGRQGAYCGNVQFFSGKGYMTEHAVVAEPNDDNNAKYLAYKLGGLQLGRFSGQAAQPGLSVTKLARLRIEMPAKKYQDQVAEILSAYDDLIEVNNKRIKVLEQMAENRYKEWFVRFRFPGHETAEFENGIPGGWKVGHLLDEMTFSSGKAKPQEEGMIPVYGGNGITDWCDRYNNADVVIIGRVGAYCGAVYYEPDKCWISDNALFAKSKRKESLTQYYNYFLLKSLRLNLFQGGTGQPLITQGFLSKIRVVVPSSKIVNYYCNTVKPLFELLQKIKDQNLNLIKQRDLLLPRLMSGKLEVHA